MAYSKKEREAHSKRTVGQEKKDQANLERKALMIQSNERRKTREAANKRFREQQAALRKQKEQRAKERKTKQDAKMKKTVDTNRRRQKARQEAAKMGYQAASLETGKDFFSYPEVQKIYKKHGLQIPKSK